MNPFDENYPRDVCRPVVQTWTYPTTRYSSPSQYPFDPVARRVAHVWNSKTWERDYSSRAKAYYPVVPYNTQTLRYAPVTGNFDYTRLGQTDVLDIVYSPNVSPVQRDSVSLAHTINPLLNKMGTIGDSTTGKNLGTGTLIANNLLLVPRHVVQGLNIQNLNVRFGYTEFNGSSFVAGQTMFDCIIEENALCDYAIIQLKEPLGIHLGFVSLNIEGPTIAEPALLHYPLGKPLKVSVHTFVQTQYQTDYLLAYHDSDYFSSGGAYFDPMGRMIAMHLGTEVEENSMNLLRYALPLETVVKRNPHSLLGKLASGKLSQAQTYTADLSLIYLPPTNHNYLIDEEGRESEKILRALLMNELKKDKNIKRNKNGTISFSKLNLQYIAGKYPTKYALFEERCLGITGLHGMTHLYSVTGVVESDHTIPHNVWKTTTNSKMKKIAAGTGKRQGENDMPAITIPWGIHRTLLTTGGVPGYKNFHQTLTSLCNNGRVDDALILCYQEYQAKGLNLKAYENEIKRSLKDHVDLGLISNAQKNKIITLFF